MVRNISFVASAAIAIGSVAITASAAEPLVLRLQGFADNDLRPPAVTAVAVSADGALVAAAGDDHAVRVWSTVDGAQTRLLEAHDDWVRAAKFSASDRLATVSTDRTLCVWDLTAPDAGPATRRLAGGALRCVAWTPDGEALVTTGFGDTLRLFNLGAVESASPIEWGSPSEDTCAVAVSPDGRWVAAAGRGGLVRLWDRVASGGPRDLPSDGRRVRAVAFSPDGETLAAGGDGPAVRLWRRDGEAFAPTPEELLVRPGKVHALEFLDDATLAVGGTLNTVALWSTDTRSTRGVLRGHTGTVATLAASADGRVLVSGSFDTTVRVWDAESLAASVVKTAGRPATDRDAR